nr:MAG TPA: hypothetical protein [Caudoviricetes sp.]
MINKADIQSFAASAGVVTALNIGSGVPYGVASQKKGFSVSETVRMNDGAPNGYAHEVTVTAYEKENPTLFNQLANGNVVFIAKRARYCRIYGLFYGLQTTASSMNSNENGGWATFTFTTPEGVIGEDYLTVKDQVYDAIFNAVV